MPCQNKEQFPKKILYRESVIAKLISNKIDQREAGKLLKLSIRQIRRITKRYLTHGVAGLLSKKIGRISNNKIPDTVRDHYIDIVRTHYHDFGPTLAHEKLTEKHEAHFSIETLRQWMILAELWEPHLKPKARQHPLRDRRSRVGELVQIDGSLHHWFEGRASQCTLLVAIDDATSRILGALFATIENTENYLQMFKHYFQTYGTPVSLYADKHAVFKVNHKGCEDHDTQFGRIVSELGIELIHAHTAQAKGRVERVFKTLQDRLVKELRLENISDIDSANKFLEKYLPIHNDKFSVAPESNVDAHTPLTLSDNELEMALAFKYKRIVRNDYSISLHGKKINLYADSQLPCLRRQNVDVFNLLNKKIVVQIQGRSICAKLQDGAGSNHEDVTTKTLNKSVDAAISKQSKQTHPIAHTPWMTQEAFAFEGHPVI